MGAVGSSEDGVLRGASSGEGGWAIQAVAPQPENPSLSFYILDLFANLFQLGFALDDNLGDLGVVCFSAERIQLAAEFLADELKRSPDGQLLVVVSMS